MLDMTRAREVFEASEDFTVGLEEEFQILDPATRSLAHRFGELNQLAQEDEVLAVAVAGDLIESEIEIRSGKGATFDDATTSQRDARARLFRLAADNDALLAATGTHPWSPWQEQRIIDTDHYRRVEEGLQYVAWRNNTFSLHVHVGIRGADRAIAVCDRLRPVLPELLAISANSPFLDGRDSGLHTARTQIFTKSFPRCGIPDPLGSFDEYAELRGPARPYGLDRRAHPALVERAAAHRLRHGGVPDLRRADRCGGVHGARGPDHGVRGAGGARPRRGCAIRRPAAAA